MFAIKIILIIVGVLALILAAFSPKRILKMNMKKYSKEFFRDEIKGYNDLRKGTKSIYSFDFILTVLLFWKHIIYEFFIGYFFIRYPRVFLGSLGVCLMGAATVIHYFF